jgi:hypothetical protein
LKTNSAHEMKAYKHGPELVSLYVSDNWTVFFALRETLTANYTLR